MRHIRNTLYFFLGLALALFWLSPSHAQGVYTGLGHLFYAGASGTFNTSVPYVVYGPGAGGSVIPSGTTTINLPRASLPVTLRTNLPVSTVAAGLVKGIARSTVYGLASQLILEAGMRYLAETGEWQVKSTPDPYTVGVCVWGGFPNGGPGPGFTGKTADECGAIGAVWLTNFYTAAGSTSVPITYAGSVDKGSYIQTKYRTKTGAIWDIGALSTLTRVTPDSEWQTISEAEAQGRLEEQMVPKDNSGIAQGLQQEGIPLEESGTPQASGPASVSAPSQTVNNVTNNTTTTNTTVYNITYNNNVVNSTTTTTSKTVDNASGKTLSETNATEETEAKENVSVKDTQLGEVPKLYKQKYPQGMKGVWNSKIAEIKAAPLFSLAGVLFAPSIDGGTCPKWTIGMNTGIVNLGSGVIEPPCWIWPVIKAFVVITALLLARSLIFGG